MNRKAYNKVHERYYADPVGFITGSMPNVTVKVSDEHGNATKNPKTFLIIHWNDNISPHP